MIDLHLHTTASDGLLSPGDLVVRAAQAGLRVISVTDHDTVAGLEEAGGAARRLGLRLIDGIEVTAIEDGRDVHVLGYFFDPADAPLGRLLADQRAERVLRVREMGARLAALRCPIDVDGLLRAAARQPGRSVGRPALADALVSAGHAVDRRDAFDRLLGANAPAFVPRRGPSVAVVVAAIAGAGGIASLAHPGLTRVDDAIPRFASSGMAAIEARHRDHSEATETHYRTMAAALGLAVSGGSDYHGEFAGDLGRITLDSADLTALEQRARRPATGGVQRQA